MCDFSKATSVTTKTSTCQCNSPKSRSWEKADVIYGFSEGPLNHDISCHIVSACCMLDRSFGDAFCHNSAQYHSWNDTCIACVGQQDSRDISILELHALGLGAWHVWGRNACRNYTWTRGSTGVQRYGCIPRSARRTAWERSPQKLGAPNLLFWRVLGWRERFGTRPCSSPSHFGIRLYFLRPHFPSVEITHKNAKKYIVGGGGCLSGNFMRRSTSSGLRDARKIGFASVPSVGFNWSPISICFGNLKKDYIYIYMATAHSVIYILAVFNI